MTKKQVDPVDPETVRQHEQVVRRTGCHVRSVHGETTVVPASSADAGQSHVEPLRELGKDSLERRNLLLPVLDAIDMASDQSFPASDPPAWIWR